MNALICVFLWVSVKYQVICSNFETEISQRHKHYIPCLISLILYQRNPGGQPVVQGQPFLEIKVTHLYRLEKKLERSSVSIKGQPD